MTRLADAFPSDLWGRRARRLARVDAASARSPVPNGNWIAAMWHCSCGNTCHRRTRKCSRCGRDRTS